MRQQCQLICCFLELLTYFRLSAIMLDQFLHNHHFIGGPRVSWRSDRLDTWYPKQGTQNNLIMTIVERRRQTTKYGCTPCKNNPCTSEIDSEEYTNIDLFDDGMIISQIRWNQLFAFDHGTGRCSSLKGARNHKSCPPKMLQTISVVGPWKQTDGKINRSQKVQLRIGKKQNFAAVAILTRTIIDE